MKKTLVSALTTALVVGAASTTFAAANPFSDVPADHWAYDAVSQLAADGVIDGYGDSTFKGNRNITRYEMAQMVAKAMAKNTSGADKALVDKLAAEFADELNNLGVRVANLERNADKVKWNGEARYTFQRTAVENDADNGKTQELLLRLEPSAEINDHWHANARIDANIDWNNDTRESSVTAATLAGGEVAARSTEDDNTLRLRRIWAQGDYTNFQVRVGKFGNKIANDLVYDDNFSGIDATFGKDLKATVAFGRIESTRIKANVSDALGGVVNEASTMWGIGLNYDKGSKFNARAAYQHFTLGTDGVDSNGDNIWSVGAGYKFDKNVALDATYAHGNLDIGDRNGRNTAFAYTLSYKGAEATNKGTWGAWLGYRYLGEGAALHPTYDVVDCGTKGWEIGVKYVPMTNVLAQLQYGSGKVMSSDNTYNSLFGRVEFLF